MKEIYAWKAPHPLYAFNWSERKNSPEFGFRLAVGSFIEEYSNKVSIIQLDPEADAFVHRATLDHPYPATKIKWIPDPEGIHEDLLATTGDYLRIWKVSGSGVDHEPVLKCILNGNKDTEVCAPLTSFDWNEVDPNIIGTCSIDTTCTLWDIEREVVTTQLIAHDDEVYDIAFGKGKNEFASVGGDGHIRMFDLRYLEHSTIMYECPDNVPLLRLAWNKQDPNYIAAVQMDSSLTTIIDIRVPTKPVSQLGGHNASVTSVAWAPHSGGHICTSGDDARALIWDVWHVQSRPSLDPILAYNAEAEINQLQWSKANPYWVAIVFENKLQALRV